VSGAKAARRTRKDEAMRFMLLQNYGDPRAGLVDELHVVIVPILLGSGERWSS
jgi:hypothetical protein